MKKTHLQTTLILAALQSLYAAAFAQSPDTSEWLCEFCPFEAGHHAEYQVGASSVSDDSAWIGDATGYDEEGVYANLDGSGRYTRDSFRLGWTAEDLGLDSRAASLSGGKPGVYDFSVDCRQIPRRRYDTTSSIFVRSGGAELSLPAGWVPAPVTSGFSALDESLTRQSIESDRSIWQIGGRYRGQDNLQFSASYRRQEYDGLKVMGGSTYTNASLLPMPFDYATDAIDLGVRYGANNAFVSLAWYLSDFDSAYDAVRWQQPFQFSAPFGTDTLALAQAPDNQFQQLTLAGGYAFPARRTSINASLAFGQLDQDAQFLPYTSNSALAPNTLPRSSLDGDVSTTNIAVALTSRPLDKTRIEVSYRFDKRDNKTRQDLFERVILDSVLSGDPELNTPYSYDRGKLRISGAYELFDSVRLSGGYDRVEFDRDFQEVASQTEDTGWGGLRWRPVAAIEIDAKGGVAERDIDRYNDVFAASMGENPLLRKYNLAYRYRRFGDLRFSWSPGTAAVSVAVSGRFAEDDYAKSRVGMTSGDERALAADVSWSLSDTTSLYVNAGIEQLRSEQAGSEQFGDADWSASNDDDFTSVGAGIRMRNIVDAVDLQFDYTRSEGSTAIRLRSAAGGEDPFPDLDSVFDHLRLRLSYQRSERFALSANIGYQRFKADDWALAGVQPATIPVVLSLGALPYDEEVFVVGVSASYRVGK